MKSVNKAYMRGLIADALDGDSNSFAILFASSYRDLYAQIARVIDNTYDIQDLLFGTYILAFSRLDNLRNPARFYHWIKIICRGRLHTALIEQGKTPAQVRKILNSRNGAGNSYNVFGLDTASQLLEFILSELNIDNNTVPLETLLEYHQYKNSKLWIQRLLILVAIFFIMIVPLYFLTPTITLTKNQSLSTPQAVVYNAEVKSVIPITSVISHLNSKSVTVMQDETDLYSLTVTENGKLDIVCTAMNRKTDSDTVEVVDIDVDPPSVTSYSLSGDTLILTVEDEGYGVDFEKITIVNLSDSAVYYPIKYDEQTGEVVMPYTHQAMTLGISDKADNSTSFAITPN